jgi:transcriptional regulator with PAS, ATPase and Fis domain
MVLEKEFRADLYYRLKIGYLYLPPLRERLCDIDGLVSYFIKMETAADIKISKKVTDEFMKYKWLGNVRELESTIKYMIAVRTGNVLEMSDLPDRKFFEETIKVTSLYCEKNEEDYNISSESIKILNCIYKMQSQNVAAGREKISSNLKECGYNLTSSQVRTRLCNLESQGYITKSRGRQGTVLTDMGISVIKNINFK